MIELPTDEARDDKSQVIFPCEELWVPVACVNGNVHIRTGSSLHSLHFNLKIPLSPSRAAILKAASLPSASL